MPIAYVLLMKLEKNLKNIRNWDDNLFKMFLSITGITSLQHTPCTTHKTLPFMDKRDISEGNHGICDYSYIPISGQWYKVEGQDVLTNESLVSFFTCGTEVPIWVRLQGQSLLVSQKRNPTDIFKLMYTHEIIWYIF